MNSHNFKRVLLSKTGIFILLVCVIAVLVAVLEWYSSNSSNRYSLSDNHDGKAAVEHFKEGERLFKLGEDYQAMEELLEAEKYCNNIKNDLLRGAINWYKGDLYYKRLDFKNALNMYLLSMESYQLCGKRDWVMELYGKIAEIHFKEKNYEEAIFNYGKARGISLEMVEKERRLLQKGKRDSTLFKKYEEASLKYSSSLLGGYYGKESSPEETLSNLREVYSMYNKGHENPEDYPLIAYIYLNSKDTKRAERYINDYINWRYSSNSKKGDLSGIEKAGIYLFKSDIAKIEGNYRDALSYKERYYAIIDSISTIERSQSIREAESEYWQRELTRQNDQVKQKSKYTLVIYLLIILLVSLVLFTIINAYRRRIERKNAEIDNYMQTLRCLDEELSTAKAGNVSILQQLDTQKEREKHLKELLEGRFAEVRELVRTYYEYGNSKKLQKKVDDLLKLQLTGDNFEVMEEVVNAKNDNVIKRVREKYPSIKEDNIKLLNLVYAGFSAQEISVILNDTPQNIYVRKSRLKKLISEVESDM